MTKMRLKGTEGFTLLELLMVVIIIAILASIALPQYLRAAERAKASEALQMLGSMRGAELRYAAGSPTQAYTGTLAELDTDIPTPTALWTYTANAAAPGRGFATRVGAVANILGINFTTGNTCATVNTYGLAVVAGANCP